MRTESEETRLEVAITELADEICGLKLRGINYNNSNPQSIRWIRDWKEITFFFPPKYTEMSIFTILDIVENVLIHIAEGRDAQLSSSSVLEMRKVLGLKMSLYDEQGEYKGVTAND